MLVVAVAGCGSSSITCPTGGRAALTLDVRDALTNRSINDSAAATITELPGKPGTDGGPGIVRPLANSQVVAFWNGRYALRIDAPGYVSAYDTVTIVGDGSRCNYPVEQTKTIRLVRRT